MLASQAWIFFALFAGLGLFGYNMCAKLGGGNLPPVIFASIMYLSGVIAVLPIFFWFMKDKKAGYLSELPLMAVLYAIGAGVVVILVDTCVATMFNKNAPVGLGMTFIFIISLSLTTMAGLIVFKEGYSVVNLLGIFLALVSIPLMFYKTK